MAKNGYQILNNPFLSGARDGESGVAKADVENRTKQILTKLNSFSGYQPMSATAIGDWSLESGDTIRVETDRLHDGTVLERLNLPIFGQTMEWNGGMRTTYQSTGSEVRPKESIEVREKNQQDKNAYDTHYKAVDTYNRTFGAGGLSTTVENNKDGVERWWEFYACEGEFKSLQGKLWKEGDNIVSAVSQIRQTADGVESAVEQNLGKYDANGKFQLVEKFFTNVNQSAKDFTITASKVSVDMNGQEKTISSMFKVENNKILMKSESIDLKGYVTMDAFNAKFGKAGLVETGGVVTNTLSVQGGKDGTGMYCSADANFTGDVTMNDLTIGGQNAELTVNGDLKITKNADFVWHGDTINFDNYATEKWVGSRGYLTKLPRHSHYVTINGKTYDTSPSGSEDW